MLGDELAMLKKVLCHAVVHKNMCQFKLEELTRLSYQLRI